MIIDKKSFNYNISFYGSELLAIYQFHGNTKKIPFIPFILAISKFDALQALDEIENECTYINVIVLRDKIVFENQENEELWTIESSNKESNKNLSKEYIDFINVEKNGLNLNYIEDLKRNLTIFRESSL